MAKQKIPTDKNGIPVRCEYCKHNKGENMRFRYMWHCSYLSFCVVFDLHYCKANKEGKGNFEVNMIKYNEYKPKQK